jgi:hypothetical protein
MGSSTNDERPSAASTGTSTRHQYRTVAGYEMDDRRLKLRGGVYDGRIWVGRVSVGSRVFCGGDDAWSTEGMYLVSAQVEVDDDGPANIATPAFASE